MSQALRYFTRAWPAYTLINAIADHTMGTGPDFQQDLTRSVVDLVWYNIIVVYA